MVSISAAIFAAMFINRSAPNKRAPHGFSSSRDGYSGPKSNNFDPILCILYKMGLLFWQTFADPFLLGFFNAGADVHCETCLFLKKKGVFIAGTHPPTHLQKVPWYFLIFATKPLEHPPPPSSAQSAPIFGTVKRVYFARVYCSRMVDQNFCERVFFANERKAVTIEDVKHPKNKQSTRKRA